MDKIKKSPALLKLSASCKAAARKKFKVYPSAYANMWASKTQKKGKCKAERRKVINAKIAAGKAGKYKRSSKSNVTGTKSKNLKDWVKQEFAINYELRNELKK